MKCVFPTLLLTLSLAIIPTITQAKLTPAARSTMIETLTTLRKAVEMFKQKPTHKPAVTPSTPKIQEPAKAQEPVVEAPKSALIFSPNSDLPVKTMQEVVADAIDKTQQEKFGIAALIKAMREQALNEGNPHKYVFKESLPTAEKFLTFKGGLFDAKNLYEQLHPETKKALTIETDKRDLSWFQKKKFLEDFLAANSLT